MDVPRMVQTGIIHTIRYGTTPASWAANVLCNPQWTGNKLKHLIHDLTSNLLHTWSTA